MRSLTFFLLLFVPACAAGPGQFLQRPDTPIGWPAADPEPRITYDFLYHGREDAQLDPGFWTQLGRWIVGEEHQSLGAPYGMSLSADGLTLLIADTGYGVVHLLDLETGEHNFVDGGSEFKLVTPVGVAAVEDGRFFVTDSTRSEVIVFDADGNALSSFGSAQELGRPTGIVWDASRQRLLILDTTGGRLLVFNSDGVLLKEVGNPGADAGSFNHPTNLAVAPDGHVFLTDTLNFRVQVLDPNFEPAWEFGMAGNGRGTFAKPKGIALDSEGHVYVVDAMFDNIQIFDAHGVLLLTFCQSGGGFGGLHLPTGIFISKDNRIFVADTGNSRIQVFRFHPRIAQP
jgi:DNA-binding beta-propeller fold protein YncE